MMDFTVILVLGSYLFFIAWVMMMECILFLARM